MALVVIDVVLPSVLAGQRNGRLDANLLRTVVDPYGGPTIQLLEVAARSHAALVHAARLAGFILKATGSHDGYRDYETQVRVFTQRYSVEPQTTGFARSRVWQGQRWWLLPEYVHAPAAVPGTSNHGWGLAKDFAEERDGDAQPESISAAAVNWLNANAPRFGWSAEVQVEAWHWRHVTGDKVTPAVLAYEKEMAMADVYYKINSADPAYNGKIYLSNRIHRRGPLRNPGNIQNPAKAGATEVVLTDAMLNDVGGSWEEYLTAVAGPPFPTLTEDDSSETYTFKFEGTGTATPSVH